MIRVIETAQGARFTVRVVPRASRSEIVGEFDGALRVRLASPPVEGAANRELVKVLAKALKVPQSAIEIVSGLSSRNKTVRVRNMEGETFERLKSLG